MKIKKLRKKLVAYVMLACMTLQLTSGFAVQAANNNEVPFGTRIDAANIESGKEYILAGENITCSDHGLGQYAISGKDNGNASPKLLSHVPYATYEDITDDMIWKLESYGNGYSLQSKEAGKEVSDELITKLTTANTTGGAYTLTDTEEGLQLSGASWGNDSTYARHTLATPMSGADIKTLTFRYKSSGGPAAIVYVYSGSERFYVNLSNLKSDTDGVVRLVTDEAGFTVVTLDFQNISLDGSDTWLPADRATKNLTAIAFLCNNAAGTPVFDYIGYNMDLMAGTDVVFTTTNTTGGAYTLTDTEDGLQLSGASWGSDSTYARHTLASPIPGSGIETITIRYKVSGGEAAIMYFYSGSSRFYVNLSNLKSDTEGVTRLATEDGLTVVTLDFKNISLDGSDTWLPADRATKDLTKVAMLCNNASGTPTFHSMTFNEVFEEDDSNEVLFSTANTTKGIYTLTDTTDGLQLSGAAWGADSTYARYTLPTPKAGADIETITIRYKVSGGEAAIMYFYSGSSRFYINLSGLKSDTAGVTKLTTENGLTAVTLDFKNISLDGSDTWLPADRASKELTGVAMLCNNASGKPTFHSMTFNEDGGQATGLETIVLNTGNTSKGIYTLTDTADGLQLSGAAWGADSTYAKHTLATPASGAEIETITVRYKVSGGEAAIMYFYSGSSRFYLNLSGLKTSTAGVESIETDAQGYTVVTFDFQTINTDASDTWLPADRTTKDLTAFAMLCNNASGTPTFHSVMFNGGAADAPAEEPNLDNSYMNIAVRDGVPHLELGQKQELTLTVNADGTLMISATIEGTEYFVRFTGSNGIGWEAGTGTNSRNLTVYEVSMMDTDVEEPRETPLYTIAAFTDMHVDYNIEDRENVIREQTQLALETIKTKENPDMVLIGGDTISTHGTEVWDDAVYQKVTSQVQAAFGAVSKNGKVLYVNGNHDYEAGATEYNSGAWIDSTMQANVGEYKKVLYEGADRKNNLLAYYYEIDGIHYIGINTPYNGDVAISGNKYPAEALTFVEETLATIDKDEMVIVLAHYGFKDSRGITTTNYGLYADVDVQLKNTLLKYPNVLYLYGHDHGGQGAYIQSETFERVTPYNADGTVVNQKDVDNSSFTSSFMGSLSYYKNNFNNDWLSAEQPKVVQALMIYVYADRIDLQMKNYGEKTGAREHIYDYSISRGFEITSDVYTIDQVKSYVTDVAHRTTIADFLDGFDHKEQLEIYGVNGKKITDTTRELRSGMTLKRYKDGAYVDELEVRINQAAVSDLPYTIQKVTVENNAVTGLQILANTDITENAVGFVGLYDADGAMLDSTWTAVNGSGTYPLSLSLAGLPEGGTYRAIVYDSMITAEPQSYLVTSDDERHVIDRIATSAETELIAGVDQRNKQIVLYNPNDAVWDDTTAVWKWKPTADLGFRSASMFGGSNTTNPSDAKLRYSDFYGGYVMVATSSGGFVSVIDYETGECLFERKTNSSGENNPHAIELLPNGNVVVASSAGNSVTIYAATTGDGEGYYKKYNFRDAHGLLWDPEQEILWALGLTELIAYQVTGTTAEPTLEEIPDMKYTLPAHEGHDLYPVYGDNDLLWTTMHTPGCALLFRKSTGTFIENHESYPYINENNPTSKSAGTQPYSGSIVILIPNGATFSWDSDTVDWFTPNGDGTYTHESRVSDGAYYKARVWHYKYQ